MFHKNGPWKKKVFFVKIQLQSSDVLYVSAGTLPASIETRLEAAWKRNFSFLWLHFFFLFTVYIKGDRYTSDFSEKFWKLKV